MKISRTVAIAAAVPVLAVAAQTMASAAPAAVSPAQRTCSAFQTWEHSKTTAHLDAMVVDSFTAPWRYVGEDAAHLYSDVRGGRASAKYLPSDIHYFAEDCR